MASIIIDGFPEVPEGRTESAWGNDELAIRVDEMFARRLDNEMADGIHAVLDHPETGLFAKQGEDALAAIPDAMQALDRLRQQTLAQTVGDRQSELVRPVIEARLEAALKRIAGLSRQTTDALDDEISDGRVERFKRDAAAAWDDMEQLRELGRAALTERRYQGERRGWSKDEVEAKARQDLSDLYAHAAEGALRIDIEGAQALVQHSGPAIEPATRSGIELKLAISRQQLVAKQIGDAVSREWSDIVFRPKGTSEALSANPQPHLRWFLDKAHEHSGQSADAALNAAVESQAVARFFHAGQAWLTERSNAVNAILSWREQNPKALLLDVPHELRSRLASDQILAFERFARSRGEVAMDSGLFDRLEREAFDNPSRFAATALDEYVLHLGFGGVDRLKLMQQAIHKGDADGAFARLKEARRLVERAIIGFGLEADATSAEQVRAEARGRVEDFGKINGRSPTGEDIVRIVDEVTTELRPNQAEAGLADKDVEIAQLPSPASELESGVPSLPKRETSSRDRSKMYLKFDGLYLRLHDGDEVVGEWPAVSGVENFGSAKNQNVPNYGPIPEGTYDIKQSRYQALSPRDRILGRLGAGSWPGGESGWGTERIWADATKETEESGLTFGRKDMAIHGGQTPGSAGCIDLTGHMADFAKAFRGLGIDLKLYVDYQRPIPLP